MNIKKCYQAYQGFVYGLSHMDFMALLPLRLLLAIPFWIAGLRKFSHIQDVAVWFEQLHIPFPLFSAYLAAGTEVLGAVLLILGLAVRFISIPLIVTMLVAIFAVHWDYGWYAIAPSQLMPQLTTGGVVVPENVEIVERLSRGRELLQGGNYDWLTEKGNWVILQNGIEFATTYLIGLLVLLVFGAGRYFSYDYWLAKKIRLRIQA